MSVKVFVVLLERGTVTWFLVAPNGMDAQAFATRVAPPAVTHILVASSAVTVLLALTTLVPVAYQVQLKKI